MSTGKNEHFIFDPKPHMYVMLMTVNEVLNQMVRNGKDKYIFGTILPYNTLHVPHNMNGFLKIQTLSKLS